MNKKTSKLESRMSFDIPSIKDSITSYKPDIKKASVEFYISGIKKVIELGSSKKKDGHGVLKLSEIKKTKKIIGVLEDSIKSISSRKNIVSSILVFLGSLKESPSSPIGKALITYQEYHKNLAKKKEESYMDNEMSPREKENWITGEDISNKIKKLKDEMEDIRKTIVIEDGYKNIPRTLVDTYQKYLVLNLYTLLPPLRNDYVNVKVIKDCENFGEKDDCVDTEFNYINFCSKKLLLCTYKTRKFYGIKRVDIPDELFEIIQEWETLKGVYLEEKGCSNSEGFLLINTTNCEKMLSNSLTKYINRIFSPKKVSTTMLRKIYLSEKYPVVVSYRDQARDAMIMGHSLSMQKMVYSKKIEK